MVRLKDLLQRRSAGTFVGRGAELEFLRKALAAGEEPLVIYIHGMAGIGKSRLLDAFAEEARSRDARVVRLDCRQIEPTENGLLRELAAAIGGTAASTEQVAARLGALGSRVVLSLDTYEVFRLLDTWLRQVFIPALPDNVRVILCGRDAPVVAWLSAPGWHGLFRTIRLESLPERDALDLLRQSGLSVDEARRMERFTHGHPLALTLAAALVARGEGVDLEHVAGQRVLAELSRIYVSDIHDVRTRTTVEAASVVRRITGPLLHAMLPSDAPRDALERMRALPFIEQGQDGLQMHDAVREAIAANLRAGDPLRYRGYRRAAYHQLTADLRSASQTDLWRYTADLLYILENPIVREAFFPTGSNDYAVEPARAEDRGVILGTIQAHEGPLGARCLTRLWNYAPETFSVARDRKGAAVGFYCSFDPRTTPAQAYKDDPLVQKWLEHLDGHPIPRKQRVFFLRRWLSHDEGEALSAVQAVCWLDMKRKYLELRPDLRRVYLTLRDLTPYLPAAGKLGFQLLTEADVEEQGEVYHSAMLDMGPASVEGWLARLVASELGVEEGGLLDLAARELVIDGARVGLTKLEFSVMEYLSRRPGEAVSRADFLENVWGNAFHGGSNVIDAVIRGLRKKLGNRAAVLETVQGVGYRLRGE
jgi:Transcriptional regulatory protein, C terminal/AAA ATPase domain